jgi:hypothetical protein
MMDVRAVKSGDWQYQVRTIKRLLQKKKQIIIFRRFSDDRKTTSMTSVLIKTGV